MNYHSFDSKKAFEESKTPLSPWDVLVFLDTRDVYSVPGTGGEPKFAFNATARDLPIPELTPMPAARLTIPAIGDKPLMRVRFESRHSDYRPVAWPIKHPYWCTGTFTYTDEKGQLADGCIIVAYIESLAEVDAGWPEAGEVSVMDAEQSFYTFTDRFGAAESILTYYGLPKPAANLELPELCNDAVEKFKTIYPNCFCPSGAAARIHQWHEHQHEALVRKNPGSESSDAVLRSKHAAAEAEALGGEDDTISIEVGDKKLSF